jgi:hypothetical protein
MTEQNNILLNFKGSVDYEIHEHLIEQAKGIIETSSTKILFKKRIIYILIEGLENIFKHSLKSNIPESLKLEYPDQITVVTHENEYNIKMGNLILNDEILPLKTRLENVNQIDVAGLRRKIKNRITQNKISVNGGAGLGLIRIALKSGKKIIYTFEPVNDAVSYFKMQVKIMND